MELAYTPVRESSEHPKTYNRRLYTALLTCVHSAAGHPVLCVQKLWPNIDWVRTWKNLNETPVPETTRCTWYRVINDLIPTNVRLHRTIMVPSDTCRQCRAIDTLEYRLITCGEGRRIWHYSKTLIARMMRTIPASIPDDWILHPQFNIWSSKTHRAILWIIATVVIFRIQQQANLTVLNYMEFLHRSR